MQQTALILVLITWQLFAASSRNVLSAADGNQDLSSPSCTDFSELATEANVWHKLKGATIEGRRYETPLGYSPELKRFLILGGRTSWADYKKPRSFDQLALDFGTSQWENWFPAGKEWGPKQGACNAPAWKDEYWGVSGSRRQRPTELDGLWHVFAGSCL